MENIVTAFKDVEVIRAKLKRRLELFNVPEENVNEELWGKMFDFIRQERNIYEEISIRRQQTQANEGGDGPPSKRPKRLAGDLNTEKLESERLIIKIEEELEELYNKEFVFYNVHKLDDVFNRVCMLYFQKHETLRTGMLEQLLAAYEMLDDAVLVQLESPSTSIEHSKRGSSKPSNWTEEDVKQHIRYVKSAPVQMYCDGFFKFDEYIKKGNECLEKSKNIEGLDESQKSDIEDVQSFLEISGDLITLAKEAADGKYVTNENDFKEALWHILNRCFLHRRVEHGSIKTKGATSDGFIKTKNGKGFLLHIEFKGKFNAGIAQSFAYYQAYTDEIKKNIGYYPSFILFISGHVFFLFGAIMLRNKPNINSMIRPVDLIKVEVLKDLSVLLYALKKSLADLDRYYDGELPNENFPIIRDRTILQHISERKLAEFNYDDAIMPIFQTAKYNGSKIVIKFARNYCKEAHDICADNNIAPKIIFYENNTSYYVIMYEYIDGKPFSLGDHEVTSQLQPALDHLHKKGFVHGDFRGQNILIEEGSKKIKLIDFDWTGKADSDVYPEEINKDLRWASGVQYGHFLKKDHDTFMLKQLLRSD